MSAPRLGNVQVLRAAAASMVVVHHVSDALQRQGLRWIFHFGALEQIGAAGVDLFFVISGFIMLHVGGDGFRGWRPATEFLLRRWWRIYPSYWVVSGFSIVLWAAGVGFRSQIVDAGFLARSLLCLPMMRHPLVDQAWTLGFELYFYLLFAGGMLVLRTPGRFLAGAGVWFVASAVAANSCGIPILVGFFGNPMLFEFLFGAFIGVAHRNGWIRPNGRRGSLALAVALVTLCVEAVTGIDWQWRAVAWGVPAALLLAAALSLPQIEGGRWRFLLVLGDASYSIYLVHGLVALALPRFAARMTGNGSWGEFVGGGACLAALLLGWLFWRLVEVPLQRRSPFRRGREVARGGGR